MNRSGRNARSAVLAASVAALGLVLAGGADAQTRQAEPTTELRAASPQLQQGFIVTNTLEQHLANDIIDSPVYGTTGENIGNVSDLIVEPEGRLVGHDQAPRRPTDDGRHRRDGSGGQAVRGACGADPGSARGSAELPALRSRLGSRARTWRAGDGGARAGGAGCAAVASRPSSSRAHASA